VLDLPKQQMCIEDGGFIVTERQQFAIATLEFPVAPFELLPVNVAIQSESHLWGFGWE